MKSIAILQARMSSSRLPGKVLMEVNGKPLIHWQILRILESRVERLIVATTTDEADDILVEYLLAIGVEVYRGSPTNVFSRFLDIVLEQKPDYFLRLTADCPLVMPKIVDQMIDLFEKFSPNYLTNTIKPTYPDGLDVEIVESNAFVELSKFKLTPEELEHVTLGFRSRPNNFSTLNIENQINLGHLRWTLDYPEDFEFISSVYQVIIGKETSFTFEEILNLTESGIVAENKKSGQFRNISLGQPIKGEQ